MEDQGPDLRIETDTGIRLLNLLIKADSEHTNPNDWRLIWDKITVCVDNSTLNRFLHQHGIPTAFYTRDVNIGKTEFQDRNMQVDLEYSIHHKDIPQEFIKIQMLFASGHISKLLQQLPILRKDLQQQIPERLVALNSYHGIPVTGWGKQKSGRQLQSQLVLLQDCEINTSWLISEQANIEIAPSINQKQRQFILQAILKAVPELASLTHLIVIDTVQIHYNPVGLSGTLSLLGTIANASENMTGIQWALSENKGVSVRLPENFKQYLNSLHGTRQAKLDLATIQKDAQKYLDNRYYAIKNYVHIQTLENTDYGPILSLTLEIADWLELALGPMPVPENGQVQQTIDQLLHPQFVQENFQRQLPKDFRHPYYGKTNAQLKSCNLLTGIITLAQSIPVCVYDKQEQINWQQNISVQNGKWCQPSEQNICNILREPLQEVENFIEKTLKAYLGVEFELKVKNNAFGDGRWLKLQPFAMYFSATAKIPYFPFKLSVPDILLDEQGVHLPLALRATYQRTFPVLALNLAISNPTVEVNLDAKGLAIEASPKKSVFELS
jgi:hypothetical protein